MGGSSMGPEKMLGLKEGLPEWARRKMLYGVVTQFFDITALWELFVKGRNIHWSHLFLLDPAEGC